MRVIGCLPGRAQRLSKRLSDCHRRIQRLIRVLEYELRHMHRPAGRAALAVRIPHIAGIRAFQMDQAAHDRGLAGTGGAHQTEDFAGMHLE